MFKYISDRFTWIPLDAEVEEEGLDGQQDVRYRQAGQGGVHVPAEAKHLIAELCIHSNLEQDMQIDEHVVPASRSKRLRANIEDYNSLTQKRKAKIQH